MAKRIEFDLDLYKTGKYDVVTREGNMVEIRLTNGREKYPIVGYKENDCHFPSCWTAKGRYLIDKKEDEYDLFLVEKEQSKEPSKEQTKVDEALVWAMIGATDAVLIKEKDKFSYEIDMYESPTEKGVRQLTTISIEAPTPYAAAVALYKKLKGE